MEEVVQIDRNSFEQLVKMTKEIHERIFEKQLIRNSYELLTVQELSVSLNISESTIYRAIRRKYITKTEEGKLHPLDIDDAISKKRIKCSPQHAAEFRITYVNR